MMNQLRSIAAQLSPGRAVVAAMLMGPAVSALLALLSFGVVAAEAEIKIDNLPFSRVEITIPVGTTLTWVNKGDVRTTSSIRNKAFRSKV
jgi:plastocyanin